MKTIRVYSMVLAVALFFLFTTRSTAQPERIKIAVWGDSRENADGATERIADILLGEITDWDVILHTGDFTSSGKNRDWKRSLEYRGMRELWHSGKFLMCTGNHDRVRKMWDRYTAGILPVNNADSTTHFYAKKIGSVHIIACDRYFTATDVMNEWLDDYLLTVSPDEWIIAFWHEPCFRDISYKSGSMKYARSWLRSLEKAGADFVLHGHAHVYLRSRPLLHTGAVDQTHGLVHIISGTGGANWKTAQKYSDKTAFTPREKSFPTITFITIMKESAVIETIDARPGAELRIIDRFHTYGRGRSK